MEALQQSLSSLNIQSAFAPTAIASRPSRLAPSAHLCLLPQPSPVRGSLFYNALASKVQQQTSGRGNGHRAVVVMSKSPASGYAAALADLGKSKNLLDSLYGDVEKLGRYLADPQFYGFIVNPVVRDENKKAVLKELAKEEKLQSYTLNLLNLIIDKKRTAILKEVVKEFEIIYNDLTDTQVAVVTSAVEIDKSQLSLIGKKVQSLCGSKNVKLKNVIDPSLIAGFVVRFGKDGSRLIDMSVKGQLDRIAYQIDLAEKVAAY